VASLKVVSIEVARQRRDARAEPWATKREIAAHFAVHVSTIDRWMRAGMPFEKRYDGGAVRFGKSACDAWFRRLSERGATP